ARDNAQRLPFPQRDRHPAVQPPGPDLWAAQILHDGGAQTSALAGAANECKDGPVGLVRAVRKVQPEQIDAGDEERVDLLRGVARWTYSRDDLRVTHGPPVRKSPRDRRGPW